MCEICKSNFVLYPVKANARDYYNKWIPTLHLNNPIQDTF
jgi:hypothetical protein